MAADDKKRAVKLRKPGTRAKRGIRLIEMEMGTIIDDLNYGGYGADEKRRAADIKAGLDYIDAAIQFAIGEKR